MEYLEQLLHTLQTIEQTKSFLQRRCATGLAGQSLSLFDDLASLLELVKSQYGHTDYIPRYIPMYGHSTEVLEALEYLDQVEDWTAEVRRRIDRRRLRRELANRSPLEVAEAEGKPFVATAKHMAQLAQAAASFSKAAQPLPPSPASPEERAADTDGVTVEFSSTPQLTEAQIRALPQSQQVKYFYDLRRREAQAQQSDYADAPTVPYITPVEAGARVADMAERSASVTAPSGLLHSRLQARQAMRGTQTPTTEAHVPEPTRTQTPQGTTTPARETAYRTGADAADTRPPVPAREGRSRTAAPIPEQADTRPAVPHRERPVRHRSTATDTASQPSAATSQQSSAARPMGSAASSAAERTTSQQSSAARPMGTAASSAAGRMGTEARPQRPSRTRTASEPSERPKTPFERTIPPAQEEGARPMPATSKSTAVPPLHPKEPTPKREAAPPAEEAPLGPAPNVRFQQGLMWDADRRFARLVQSLRQLDARELSRRLIEQFGKLEPRYQMVIGDTLRKNPHFGGFSPDEHLYEALERRAFHLCSFGAEWSELYNALGDMRSKTTLYAILDNWFSFNIRDTSNIRDKTFPPYLDLDVLGLAEKEVLVDCGAYTGEVVSAFAKTVEQYQHIFAFEPDPASFSQLEGRLSAYENVTLVQKAVLDNQSGTMLQKGAQPNMSFCDPRGTLAVKSTALDEEIIQKITLLKISVCGSETAVIRGAADHIHKEKPRLSICADYSPDLLWQIPKLLGRICPGYQYFLRHYGGNLVPTQYVLYAVYP